MILGSAQGFLLAVLILQKHRKRPLQSADKFLKNRAMRALMKPIEQQNV
jgi:hypothetical protein